MQKLISALLVIMIIASAAAILYPTVSDQINRWQNARRIYNYHITSEKLDPVEYESMMKAAREYNAELEGFSFEDSFTKINDARLSDPSSDDKYLSMIDPNGDGVMGVLEIPKIGVSLPIFHGTEDAALERGVGHMRGTALPVGGEGIHCGLSGHRGLPSARLLTDLDRMVAGDLFYINILGELLVYQVDAIYVVLPHELEYMDADPERDMVTLVTCTPYGINTHRLLVRGVRVPPESVFDLLSQGDELEAMPMWKSAVVCAAPFAAVGLTLVKFCSSIGKARMRKRRARRRRA